MKKAKGKTQQELLRAARTRLGVSTAELAEQLGKSEATLRAWLEPKSSRSSRTMPAGSKMLLARILEDHKTK